MGLRQIRRYGDEILTKKAKPVQAVNAGTITLLDDMLDTLRDKDGVGLAAPQVGILRRVVIIEWEEKLYELINPFIISEEGTQRCKEACLSVPGKQGEIDRPMHVTIEAMDRNGDTFTLKGEEYLASVICHELDHLDGILYLQKAISVMDRPPEEIKK